MYAKPDAVSVVHMTSAAGRFVCPPQQQSVVVGQLLFVLPSFAATSSPKSGTCTNVHVMISATAKFTAACCCTAP